MKTKRKLNGKFVSLCATIIMIIISVFKIPSFIKNSRLIELGYNEQAIKIIKEKDLTKIILENNYYSKFLNDSLVEDNFNEDYLMLYLNRNSLTNEDIKLYERLKEIKGYSDKELINIYTYLNYENILPLLVFDRLDNTNTYIEDVLKFNNTSTSFSCDNDYLHKYQNTSEVTDPSKIDVLVNTKLSISSYEPDKLAPLTLKNSSGDIKLQSTALEAFDKMTEAMANDDLSIYAIGGYVPYSYYNEKYLNDSNNQEENNDLIKPGFADRQTGLSVIVRSSVQDSSDIDFKDTDEYKWLVIHANEFGFIFRYPENKKAITGSDAIYNYLRYVGVDIAVNVTQTNMTFDEYYMLNIY